MTARFDRAWAKASRANLAASVGFLLTLSESQSASAALVTPEQRRACTPDVYRRCPGEIPSTISRTGVTTISAGMQQSWALNWRIINPPAQSVLKFRD